MSLEAFLSDSPTPAPVAAVIIAHDAAELPDSFAALERQVYEPSGRFVVGGGEAARTLAGDRGITWVPEVRDLLAAVPDDITYLWLVHDAARPRPDALRSLVVESFRVDAGIAGSKVLQLDRPDLLDSVGLATDVFQAPYSGVDIDEVDQHQFEVVRDVAVVRAASLLVRRDLLRGLGGTDRLLAPEAAAVDLCQRARLRGARVVVVPSSEVLFPVASRFATVPWREEAGRIRAALKVYSLITLIWVVPTMAALGLVEALIAPFLGRWTLFNWVRAWGWNLLYLPSTIYARMRARRGRVVGDEELFRYQLRGSSRLRDLTGEIGNALRDRFPEGGGGVEGLVEAGQQTLRSPAFLAGLGIVVFALLATRSIWGDTLPAVGFSLPPSESATATLRSYAGGWNVAGLGSPAPLHPSVGLVALAQLAVFDRPELTAAVLTIVAMIAGAAGMGRLLRSWRIGAPSAYVAGAVLMAGPATQALAGRTDWTAVLALGALPWVLRVALRSWPRTWRGRVGRIATLSWLTGVVAAGLPLLLVVPGAVLAVWGVLGRETRWWAVVRAAGAAVIAAPLLFPWFGVVSLRDYLEAGTPAFWEPWWPMVGLMAIAAAGVLLGGDRMLASIAAWGATLGAAGLLLGRLGTLDAGRDVASTGMVLGALGSAAVAGAALESYRRVEGIAAWRQALLAAGVASAVVITASTVMLVAPGRAGLPGDTVREALRFTSTAGAPTEARALVVGPAEDLPGESRSLDGAAYRVVSAPLPRLWEARLAAPRLGDRELEATLRAIIDGDVARAGEALAPFGIRWIVELGPSPFGDVFDGQLDLLPLSGLDRRVFLSEVATTRAVADDGAEWSWDPPDYRGPSQPGTMVYIAENGDQRWEPGPWRQSSWANRVGAQEGVISFEAHAPYRREAMTAGLLLMVLLVLTLWGTGRRAQ